MGALASALLVNQSLTALDLSQNRVGDRGAEALAQALREGNGLSVLNVEKASVGVLGIDALQSALEAAPAAYPPLVSADTVRFAHELALTGVCVCGFVCVCVCVCCIHKLCLLLLYMLDIFAARKNSCSDWC